MRRFFIFLVKVYQKLSSWKNDSPCRFKPTCSEYMILSIEKYGIVKGIIKGIRRVFRCHPPNGGIDYP
ncbi:MAG: membrane protein insertion efficiency factor YidD [Actinobacteria bacterium]|nr:membrane protein insertion efficiency factor YidD [Actinomycetota bacterium]